MHAWNFFSAYKLTETWSLNASQNTSIHMIRAPSNPISRAGTRIRWNYAVVWEYAYVARACHVQCPSRILSPTLHFHGGGKGHLALFSQRPPHFDYLDCIPMLESPNPTVTCFSLFSWNIPSHKSTTSPIPSFLGHPQSQLFWFCDH